jgi:hypothetical protein
MNRPSQNTERVKVERLCEGDILVTDQGEDYVEQVEDDRIGGVRLHLNGFTASSCYPRGTIVWRAR